MRCGTAEIGLTKAGPGFSENVIHFPQDPKTYGPGKDGPQFRLTKTGPDGSHEEIATFSIRVYANTKLSAGFEMPSPPSRPPCLAVVDNYFDFEVHGRLMPMDVPDKAIGREPQRFIGPGRIQLPVGWQRIEVYPLLGDEYWKSEFAPMWAELDLLGVIAQRNLITSNLNKLDSRAGARKEAARLLAEFEALLGGAEEPVHQFLKRNAILLCPTYLNVWSKLAFGDRVSDFVIQEPNNDYLLVEIEAPIRKLFRKDGQQRHELTHAMDQIADWIQYIEDNKQKVEDELGLLGISTNPRSLVVIGRSGGLTEENRRKLTTLEGRQNKLNILTYDDLLASARQNFENVLGPLQIHGQNIELYYY